MRWKSVTAVAAIFAISLTNVAQASKGGIEQVNNSFVVGFTFLSDGVASLCSGALVLPDVIATARHCVINQQGIYGTDYIFSEPGAKLDSKIDGATTPTEIKRLIVPQESPVLGVDLRLDVAFIITNKPFTTGKPISFASEQDFASLTESSQIAGYGYGAVFETGAKYSSLPRKFDLGWKGSFLVEGTKYLYEILDENNGACRGDSGGPITLKLADGSEILLGVVSGAGEVAEDCATKLSDNFYHLRFTLLHPFVSQIPTPTLVPTPKIKKITCVKGAKKKIVRGVNPKCPKGYKLKKN